MALVSFRDGRRIEVRLSGDSSDSEMLDCIVRTLQDPGDDMVNRALVDVTGLSSYEVRPAVRADITAHLAGLYCTRPGLRIGVVYCDLKVGDLGVFAAAFASFKEFPFALFVSREEADDWLKQT